MSFRQANHFRQHLPISAVLWVLFFCYATVAALLVQKLLLPLVPSLHAGQGLLHDDASYFHSVAVSLADAINQHGWGRWTLWPAQGATINVAILGALYAVFGPDPSLMIPINAALHASGGLLVYLLGRQLWPGRPGAYGGLIAATLFIVFPSALQWYSQLHKDVFAIAGSLLVLYLLVWAGGRDISLAIGWRLIVWNVVAMLLVGLARPYSLMVVFFAVACVSSVLTLRVLLPGEWRGRWKLLGSYYLVLILAATGVLLASKIHTAQDYYAARDEKTESGRVDQLSQEYGAWDGKIKSGSVSRVWTWVESSWLPGGIERRIETAARVRAGFIAFGLGVNAGSMVDPDVTPNSALSVAAYMPRALQIALFAPFPSVWLEKPSLMRLVSVGEMLIWYLFAPGILLAFYYRRSTAFLVCSIYAGTFLAVLGFINANVGTLYRMRYPFLFVFILIGAIGWVNFLLSRERNIVGTARPASEPVTSAPTGANARQLRSSAATSGILVAALTVIGFMVFFVRDLIMARWYGVGNELDAFFAAFTLPMFLVAVFCIPIGPATIAAFMEAREKNAASAQELIGKIVAAGIFLLAFLVLCSYFLMPILLPLLGSNFSAEKIQLTKTISLWVLPILALSGFVVLASSLLNALGKFAMPAWAQIVVPMLAILALLLFGREHGLLMVVVGMFVGQVVNFLIVKWALSNHGVALYPIWRYDTSSIKPFLSRYFPLVSSAFFVSAAVPLNIAMASSLSQGSVAALSLGTKVILFVTGVVGTGIATVILPHFSSYVARNDLVQARRELSFFLVMATLITIPVSIILFLESEQLVALLFGIGASLGTSDLYMVSRVLKYGVLQLPFFTVNILLLQFAVASRHSGRVLVAAILGLMINVILNGALMGHMGAAGISLASAISAGSGACLLLLMLHKFGEVSWIEVAMLILSWVLFLTLVLCLHYHSPPGVFVAGLALLFLFAGYLQRLTSLRNQEDDFGSAHNVNPKFID